MKTVKQQIKEIEGQEEPIVQVAEICSVTEYYEKVTKPSGRVSNFVIGIVIFCLLFSLGTLLWLLLR